jgi:hypothetical protein
VVVDFRSKPVEQVLDCCSLCLVCYAAVHLCYHNRSLLEPALRSSSTLTILEPHAGRALDKVVLFHQRWRQFAKKNADQVTVLVTPILQDCRHYNGCKVHYYCYTRICSADKGCANIQAAR